jgi:hypothetical protein
MRPFAASICTVVTQLRLRPVCIVAYAVLAKLTEAEGALSSTQAVVPGDLAQASVQLSPAFDRKKVCAAACAHRDTSTTPRTMSGILASSFRTN